jgi:hypothetical protein
LLSFSNSPSVGFFQLPKPLSVEGNTPILDKSTGVQNGFSIVALAPAYVKPLIKRVQKKKEEEKKKSTDSASVYKQFQVKTIFTKLAQLTEKKDTKNLKYAHEYIVSFFAFFFLLGSLPLYQLSPPSPGNVRQGYCQEHCLDGTKS